MTTPDLPDLPSDEDLGITEDDIRAFESDGLDPSSDLIEPDGSEPSDAPTSHARAPAAPNRRRGPATLAALIAVAVFASSRTGLPQFYRRPRTPLAKTTGLPKHSAARNKKNKTNDHQLQ